jgi:microcystin-dependent protein
MANPFVGEIRIFAGSFAPEGWYFCTGQSLNTTQYATLFAVIGYQYGGSGQNFNLPNLQAFASLGQGTGTGLTTRTLGQPCGVPSVTLAANQMATHQHAAQATNAQGTSNNPTNRIWARVVSTPQIQPYGKTVSAAPVAMKADALAPVGGGASHGNLQPYLGINFIMAWQGEFPVKH